MTTTPAAASPSQTNGHEPEQDPETAANAGQGHLAQKIARVAGAVGRLTRTGRVGTGSRTYTYATVHQMAAALAPLMSAEGIVMLPVEVELLERQLIEREKDRKGEEGGTYTARSYMSTVRVMWLLTDGVSEIRIVSYGTSSDAEGSEKDLNQAQTFARVNAYKAVFHLADEDPEQGGANRSNGARRQPTGELPEVGGAQVSGRIILNADGQQVALAFEANPRTAFDAICVAIRDLGGQWVAEHKVWAISPEHSRLGVVLGRHLGLTIPKDVDQRYPASNVRPKPATAAEATPLRPATAEQRDALNNLLNEMRDVHKNVPNRAYLADSEHTDELTRWLDDDDPLEHVTEQQVQKIIVRFERWAERLASEALARERDAESGPDDLPSF